MNMKRLNSSNGRAFSSYQSDQLLPKDRRQQIKMTPLF